MALSTLLGAAVAMRGRLVSIAAISLIGGYLAPLVLKGDQNLIVPFLIYLLMLQVVALVLSWWGGTAKWWGLRRLSLAATTLWSGKLLWTAQPWDITTWFSLLFAMLYQIELVLSAQRAERAMQPGAGIPFSVVVTAAITSAILWIFRHNSPTLRGEWMIMLAAATLAAGLLLRLRHFNQPIRLLAYGYRIQSALLLLLAVPVAMNGYAICLGWGAMGLALAAIGAKLNDRPTRFTAVTAWGLSIAYLFYSALNDPAAAPIQHIWLTLFAQPLPAWAIVAGVLSIAGQVIAWLSSVGRTDQSHSSEPAGISVAASLVFVITAIAALPPLGATGVLLVYAWIMFARGCRAAEARICAANAGHLGAGCGEMGRRRHACRATCARLVAHAIPSHFQSPDVHRRRHRRLHRRDVSPATLGDRFGAVPPQSPGCIRRCRGSHGRRAAHDLRPEFGSRPHRRTGRSTRVAVITGEADGVDRALDRRTAGLLIIRHTAEQRRALATHVAHACVDVRRLSRNQVRCFRHAFLVDERAAPHATAIVNLQTIAALAITAGIVAINFILAGMAGASDAADESDQMLRIWMMAIGIILWTGTFEIDRLVLSGVFPGTAIWPSWQLRNLAWTAWWTAGVTAFLAFVQWRDDTAIRRLAFLRILACVPMILAVKYLLLDTIAFRLFNGPANVTIVANAQTFAGAIVFGALILVREFLDHIAKGPSAIRGRRASRSHAPLDGNARDRSRIYLVGHGKILVRGLGVG